MVTGLATLMRCLWLCVRLSSDLVLDIVLQSIHHVWCLFGLLRNYLLIKQLVPAQIDRIQCLVLAQSTQKLQVGVRAQYVPADVQLLNVLRLFQEA